MLKGRWGPTILTWMAVATVALMLLFVMFNRSGATPDAAPSLELSNALLTAAGLILSVVSVFIVLIGVLGFAEFRHIRELKEELRAAVVDHQAAQAQVRTFLEEIEKRSSRLRSDLTAEMGSIVEAAYHFTLGENSYKEGQFTRAIAEYDRGLELRPTDSTMMVRRGRALVNLGRVEEAKTQFEAAVAAADDPSDAYYGLATAWRYADMEKALDYAARALQTNDRSCDLWNYVGMIHRDLGRLEQALHHHSQAARCDDYSQTHIYLAMVHAALGQMQSADAEARMAVVRLERDLINGDVRPVWAELTRWTAAVIAGDLDAAQSCLEWLRPKITTDRLRQTVSDQIEFVLKAPPVAAWLAAQPEDRRAAFTALARLG